MFHGRQQQEYFSWGEHFMTKGAYIHRSSAVREITVLNGKSVTKLHEYSYEHK